MDYSLRDIITSFGHIDLAVSEFIRVIDQPLPDSVFLAQVPELNKGGYTPSGTPVRVQLLGSDPEALLTNAASALRLGSHGIDFNFGCPSKTVNRHCGGAVLLKEPDRIYHILNFIHKNLPIGTALSAKMRLGFEDNMRCVEVAQAVEAAGFENLIVHGRTKRQGYKPPVDWESIGRIRETVSINVIANGDIFSAEDHRRCLEVTGCQDAMIGRGTVYQPNLAAVIAQGHKPLLWAAIPGLLIGYLDVMIAEGMPEKFLSGRLKQWTKMLGVAHDEAVTLFDTIKLLHDSHSIRRILLSLSDDRGSGQF